MDDLERLIDAVVRLQDVLTSMDVKGGAQQIVLPAKYMGQFDMAVKASPSFRYSMSVDRPSPNTRKICGAEIVAAARPAQFHRIIP